MPFVIRRGLMIGMLASVLAGVFVADSALAVVPEGPRLAGVAWGLQPSSIALRTSDPLGGALQPLFSAGQKQLPQPYPYDAPSWSPDGSQLAFTAIVGSERQRFFSGPRTKIFLVSAEGGEPRPVPGTLRGFGPVFSPDGRTIAFASQRRRLRPNGNGGGDVAFESTAAWLVGVEGGAARQLTPWQNGLANTPSSFSPDGRLLGVSRIRKEAAFQAVALRLDGSGADVLARDALAPVYSPDGSQLALLKGRRARFPRRDGATVANLTDLFVGRQDGTGLRRLTRTPKASEVLPSWDPSGERIAFTRFKFGSAKNEAGLGDEIVEVNSDGTCPIKVFSAPRGVYAGSAWQPGPGRGAGPIVCRHE